MIQVDTQCILKIYKCQGKYLTLENKVKFRGKNILVIGGIGLFIKKGGEDVEKIYTYRMYPNAEQRDKK